MNSFHPPSLVSAVRGIVRALLLPLVVLTLALPRLAAQAPATGAIIGFVSNSATSQYLDRAEIKIDGSNRSVLTDRDGSYRIGDLAPGTYTLSINYTGLDAEKQTVTVKGGEIAKQDFALTSGVYKMDKFVVATEVEGNAAQVNKQKKADFFMTAVSADTLGEVPDGNIGEFLKYIPGLQVNYVNADASTVSVRGQDPESTVFTIDGQVPPAAGTPPRSSTGSSDASSRAFEFTQAPIANIESVEVFKAPPPWMAPSTGGVINAETKNAFSQKGRVARVNLTLNINSDMLRFGPQEGPGQGSTWRLKPGGQITYSEALLNNTLGITFVHYQSNTINPTHNNSIGYTLLTAGTTAAPATEASPVRANSYTLVDGPEAKHRRTTSLGFDYKLGANTVLKFNTAYNYNLRQGRQHTYRLTTGNGTVIAPGATDRDVTVQNAQVDIFADYSDALSENYNFVGSIRHKWGRWQADGSAAYGKSDSKTTDLPEFINSVQFNLTPARGVAYRLQVAPDRGGPVSLIQVAGPDLFDLNNYNQSSLSVQTQPRFQNDRTYTLKGDLRAAFSEWRFPVEFRAGAQYYHLARRKMAGQIVLNFLGKDGIAASGDESLSAALFNDTTYSDSFLFGIRTPPLLDPYKVGVYMAENPLAFQNIQGTNVQRQAVNSQNLTQGITSAYVAATVKIGNRLTLLPGIRGEKTENFARGALRQNSLGVGLPNNSPEFFRAIYSQTQRVTSEYTDYFPQIQATYRFTPNLLFRGAVTKSMSRPGIQTILPNTTVNDTATIPSVSVNNNALLPTYSRNIDAQLEYYTTAAGQITLGFFDKKITNYIVNEQTTILPGDDNGFDGQYAGFLLNTQDNGGTGRFRGGELGVRQNLRPYLTILPEVLRGWEVFTNYSKNFKGEAPDRTGITRQPTAPNFYEWNGSYGVSYQTPRRMFYFQVRTVIYPKAITTRANGTTDLRNTYEARHQRWDFTLRYRYNRNYSLEFVGANVLEDPSRKFLVAGRITAQRDYGATYLLTFTANLDGLRLPFLDR